MLARLASLRRAFDGFLAANARFERDRRLMPPDALGDLVAYEPASRRAVAAPARARVALAVRSLDIVSATPGHPLSVRLVFANTGTGPGPSPPFVPLLVALDGQARELGESYGKPMRLAPGAVGAATLAVKPGALAPGRYFLAAFPSHPDTGRKLGAGRYHVPLDIAAAP